MVGCHFVLNGDGVVDKDRHTRRNAKHHLTADCKNCTADKAQEDLRSEVLVHPEISSIIAFTAEAGFSRGMRMIPMPELSTRIKRPH